MIAIIMIIIITITKTTIIITWTIITPWSWNTGLIFGGKSHISRVERILLFLPNTLSKDGV